MGREARRAWERAAPARRVTHGHPVPVTISPVVRGRSIGTGVLDAMSSIANCE
jgi:hypothetical protein